MSITLGKCITRELLSVYDNDTSTFNSNTETYSLNNFPLQTKKLQSRQTQHSVVSFIKSGNMLKSQLFHDRFELKSLLSI